MLALNETIGIFSNKQLYYAIPCREVIMGSGAGYSEEDFFFSSPNYNA